jgi:hypothetical protein
MAISVCGDSARYLRLHGVLAVADETLDAQMLLDPLEEQPTCHRLL